MSTSLSYSINNIDPRNYLVKENFSIQAEVVARIGYFGFIRFDGGGSGIEFTSFPSGTVCIHNTFISGQISTESRDMRVNFRSVIAIGNRLPRSTNSGDFIFGSNQTGILRSDEYQSQSRISPMIFEGGEPRGFYFQRNTDIFLNFRVQDTRINDNRRRNIAFNLDFDVTMFYSYL